MNWALAVCEANAPSSNEEAWKFIGGIWLTPYRRYQSVGLFVADSLRWCSDDEYKEVGAQLIRAGFQKEARLMLACRYDPIEIWRDHFDVVAIRLYRGLPSGVALGGIRSIEDFIALGNLNLPAQK